MKKAFVKPIFHLATLFARREAKARIRQRDWLKLASEKIRREQVGTVPTYLSVRANKFAIWKTGLKTKRFVRHIPIHLFAKMFASIQTGVRRGIRASHMVRAVIGVTPPPPPPGTTGIANAN